MAVLNIIALESGMSSGNFWSFLSSTPVVMTPLIGALAYMLKAFADVAKGSKKIQCTKKECKKEQHQHAHSGLKYLAGIIVIIILAMAWCVTTHISDEQRSLDERNYRVGMKAEIEQEVRKEISVKNLENTLEIVIAYLNDLDSELTKSVKERDVEDENREMLESTVAAIIDEFSSHSQFCRRSEGLVNRTEAMNVASALFKMQQSLVLTLLPDFQRRESAKIYLHPGDIVPTPPKLSPDEIWNRRQKALSEIQLTYLPELIKLKAQLKTLHDKSENLQVEENETIK